MKADVLIVGGGPAGSSCAWRLAAAGLDVVVIDRAHFPRPKVCAGWVTPPVFESLEIDLEDYRADRVLQPLYTLATGLVGGRTVETHYDQPVSYGIRRYEFDEYLLLRSGARLRTGEPVTHLTRRDGWWIVNGAIAAPMLVGAGGHFCPVARRLGGGGSDEPIVAAQEIEVLMSPAEERACTMAPGAVEIAFAPDLKGYGWCFRKGPYLNVGYGRQEAHTAAVSARHFAMQLRRTHGLPAAALEQWHGHAFLLYPDRARELVDDGVVLVGDSAGLAYAQSGEGIRTAVESGLLAAHAILDADGDYSRGRLQSYAARLEARFGRPGISRFLPESWTTALGARVLGSRWLTRHLVLDRWFFHRDQPALVA
jgi:geranylgeranyl reductase family protein